MFITFNIEVTGEQVETSNPAGFSKDKEGTNSFRRNNDPLICTKKQNFLQGKKLGWVLILGSCLTHLRVNNLKTKTLNWFSRTFWESSWFSKVAR